MANQIALNWFKSNLIGWHNYNPYFFFPGYGLKETSKMKNEKFQMVKKISSPT